MEAHRGELTMAASIIYGRVPISTIGKIRLGSPPKTTTFQSKGKLSLVTKVDSNKSQKVLPNASKAIL
jgi:hypothetical protein